MNDPMMLLVMVGIVSIICQFLAFKMRFPAILPLLVAGVLLGPVTGVLDPDALFGDLLFPLISLSVAIILFEGALTLKLTDLSGHGKMVRNLCTVGALVTWVVMTPVAHWGLGVSWEIACLFGAIVTVTGPTVIVPMLRSVKPVSSVANVLRWEGIIIDPIGALLAVLVYEYIVSAQHALLHTLYTFGLTLAAGGLIGLAAGWGVGVALRNNWIPHYLRNTAVLTIMLGAFALSNELAHESGLLAVTVMGLWMANMQRVDVSDILEFKETLSVLLISALFILLAARIEFSGVVALGYGTVFVLVVLIFLTRPLGVMLSSIGTKLNWRELALLSWIAPRGIVAAAVSALFAIKLESLGYTDAKAIVPMVFLVIICTVVLQSLTSRPLASFLGLRATSPKGILIFGANRFSRLLAIELMKQKVDVKLADTNWEAIADSRMDNIPVYYGNPVSEHARRTQDFSGIGRVLVLSPYKQINPLVTYHFEDTLGKGTVLSVKLNDQAGRSSHQASADYQSKLGLFGERVTYGRLASLVANGASIKTTRLSDSYTMADYKATWGDGMYPLCAITPEGKVFWFTSEVIPDAKAEWKIVSLITKEAAQAQAQKREEALAQEQQAQESDSSEPDASSALTS